MLWRNRRSVFSLLQPTEGQIRRGNASRLLKRRRRQYWRPGKQQPHCHPTVTYIWLAILSKATQKERTVCSESLSVGLDRGQESLSHDKTRSFKELRRSVGLIVTDASVPASQRATAVIEGSLARVIILFHSQSGAARHLAQADRTTALTRRRSTTNSHRDNNDNDDDASN